MKRFICIGFCLISCRFPSLGAEYIAKHGAVVSRSTLASEVGRDILKQGGNAIDAAVATGFALAVTYPSAGNLAGGGFAVIRLAKGESFALDFRETAPQKLTAEHFLTPEGNVNKTLLTLHPLASGVPGTVDGLIKMHKRFGRLPWEKVVRPAYELAKKGFRLTPPLVESFKEELEYMREYPASMKVFTNNGVPFEVNALWQQPDLAQTLKRIMKSGREGFYKGKTADLLLNTIQKNGGVMDQEDLDRYQAKWRECIEGTYRGFKIISMPPPSSGGVLLVHMLNMLELVPASEWSSPEEVHNMVEVERLSYADRAEFLCDSDFYPVPVETLTSKAYAQERFKLVSSDKANLSGKIGHGTIPYESPETTHYCTMDGEGNAVSVTTTLNWTYGSKRVVSGAGFLLNNEVDDFSVKPGVANSYGLLGNGKNQVEGGKRMLSSMTPTILISPEGHVLVVGSPGGSTIITTVLQVVLNVVDHGMTLDHAVAAPRFHHQWMPDKIRFETLAWQPALISALKRMGHHDLYQKPTPLGDVNALQLKNDVIYAVTDPRFTSLPAVY